MGRGSRPGCRTLRLSLQRSQVLAFPIKRNGREARMVSSVANLLLAAAVATASLGMSAAHAQDKLRVIVFPGLSNLAQFAAESQGFYRKRNLAVELINTPNSDELRKGLAQGKYDIAHGGVDNAVAQ